jgi:hypothetical protein
LKSVPACFELTDELKNLYLFEFDRNNFDYVFSTVALSTLNGNLYRSQRRLARRFERGHDCHVLPLDLRSSYVQSRVVEVTALWQQQKGTSSVLDEVKAIQRALEIAEDAKLRGLGVWLKDRLLGFVIFELLRDRWSVAYFEKTDTTVLGTSQFMKQRLGGALHAFGSDLVNFEEDLGLEGLRRAKLSYRPQFLLEKYAIRRCASYAISYEG